VEGTLEVSRSTLTPVRASISICKPAKSSRLVLRRRIDKQIEVAVVLIVAVENGAEDARVGHASLKD